MLFSLLYVETVELFSLQNIRLLIDKLSFTTVNFIRSENKHSIAAMEPLSTCSEFRACSECPMLPCN